MRDDSTGDSTATAVAERVQNSIDHGMSVYDPGFEESVDEYGTAFVDEYVDEVATHMAYNVVKAFEAHDLKDYIRCAQHFGEVYTFLFPARKEAETAGAGYAYALEVHDAIEDGFDAAYENGAPIEEYGDVHYGPEPLPSQEMLDNSGWNLVENGFQMVTENLGLPESYTHRGKEFGPYHAHQAAFFKYHTVAREAADAEPDSSMVGMAENMMQDHARKAQIVKFAPLVDDPDVLDEIADTYLAAVDAHDAHTMEKQWENVERMTDVYRTVLDEVIADEYWRRN